MKTNFLGASGVRNAVLLSVLMLSACASVPHGGGAVPEASARRPGEAAPPAPAATPKPVAAEPQQPSPADQGNTPPTLRKHNVESD